MLEADGSCMLFGMLRSIQRTKKETGFLAATMRGVFREGDRICVVIDEQDSDR